MTKKDWEVPLKKRQKEDIDEELFEELNATIPEEDEENQEEARAEKPFYMRVVSLLIVIGLLVYVSSRLITAFPLPDLGFLSRSQELVQIPEIKELQQAVATIETGSSRGTGFNIDSNGLIITNHHVIEGASAIRVTFPNNPPYRGDVVKEIPELDLALINIAGEGLPVLDIAQEFFLSKGDGVLVIGNPLGLTRIVKEGEITGYVNLQNWEEPVIMIKGPIHPGSSGSPVFNKEGEVVAVIFATLAGGNSEGEIIGLGIPIDKVTSLERYH